MGMGQSQQKNLGIRVLTHDHMAQKHHLALDHVEELTNRFLGPAWYRNNLSHSHATLSTLMTALRFAEVAMAMNLYPA